MSNQTVFHTIADHPNLSRQIELTQHNSPYDGTVMGAEQQQDSFFSGGNHPFIGRQSKIMDNILSSGSCINGNKQLKQYNANSLCEQHDQIVSPSCGSRSEISSISQQPKFKKYKSTMPKFNLGSMDNTFKLGSKLKNKKSLTGIQSRGSINNERVVSKTR